MPVPLVIVISVVGLVITGIIIEATFTIFKNITKNVKVPLYKNEIKL